MRLEPLRDALPFPVLVINDSPIKQFAENRHAVGQSLFESYMRFTNRATNGKRVTVFGYGACGRGTAACFRNAYADVSVVDVDPVTTLEAHFDGFRTPPREDAIRSADVIATVTGAADILTAADLPLLKDGVILLNGGHFPVEIDAAGLRDSNAVQRAVSYPKDGIETFELADGRSIHLLAGGSHDQSGGSEAARQFDRIDGSRLHIAGALSGTGRRWRSRRRPQRCAGAGRYRRGGRRSLSGAGALGRQAKERPSTMNSHRLRVAAEADAQAILNVHRRSILELGTSAYTAAECESWAAGLVPERYVEVMTSGGESFLVAEDAAGVCGFLLIQE